MPLFRRSKKVKPDMSYGARYLGGYTRFPSTLETRGKMLIFSEPDYRIRFESKKVNFEVPFSSLKGSSVVSRQGLSNKARDIWSKTGMQITDEFKKYDELSILLENRERKKGWAQYLLIEFVDKESVFQNEAAIFMVDKLAAADLNINSVASIYRHSLKKL